VPPWPEHKQNPLNAQTLWTLLRKTVSKWNDDPTLRFGAGLAYYTAFAAVPLVFIVIQLAETILGRETAEGLLLEQLQGLVGEQGAQAVGQLLDTWERAGVVGFATIVELGIMFAALAGAFAHDVEEDEPPLVEREDGSWLVSGAASADLLEDRLGVNMPHDRDYSTVAGFALSVLKRLPRTGESFSYDGWKFEVVDMDGRKIDKLLASRPKRRSREQEPATVEQD